MKKTIFCLAAGVMALTACTSTDVIEEGIQSNAIGFQNVVGKESRALTTANLDNFYVYGYYTLNGSAVNVFNADRVTKNANPEKPVQGSSVWNTTSTRYWVNGAKYFFYAYSCDNSQIQAANGSARLTPTASTLTGTNSPFTLIDYRTHSNHDLIFASNEGTNRQGIVGKESDNAAVPLTFDHILSKINIQFQSGFPAGYDIAVSNVKISNQYDIATFNPQGTTKWTNEKRSTDDDGNDDNTTEYAFPALADNIVRAAGTVGTETVTVKNIETSDAYVIPHNYENSEVTISFDIIVTRKTAEEGEAVITTASISGSWTPNWVPGTGYTYIVKINGGNAGMEKIEFSLADATETNPGGVSDWKTPADDNKPYNIEFSAN